MIRSTEESGTEGRLQASRRGYAFHMPKLPPTTIDEETLALLKQAKTAAKTSQAEVLRQCIRAQAPLIIARQRVAATFDEGIKQLSFDKKRARLLRESRKW